MAVAPTAALATWALTRLIGIDLVVSTGNGKVGPGDVATAALLAALAGWAAARLLERRSARPRAWSCYGASTALALSIIGPSWLADGSSAVALIAMHVVTAAVVVSGIAGTLPVQRNGNAKRTSQPHTSTP